MTIVLHGVRIRYGSHVAIEDLTVEIPRGAVGLLGRNGAGKSSLLKALLGLVHPVSGTMRISDSDDRICSPADLGAFVGYMPEREAYIPQRSGFDMVALLAMLSGLSKRDAWRRAHEMLYLVGLEEERYRPVSGYSTGMRQKVKLAAALVHDPEILFLDEPTNGLDPDGRSEMLRIVRSIVRDHGKSVLLSTHILQDVEAVCDAAVVLDRGRVVAQGGIAALTSGGPRGFYITCAPVCDRMMDGLQAIGRVESCTDGRLLVWLDDQVASRAIFAVAAECGGAISSLVPHRKTLEDVFLSAVGPGSHASSATGFGGAG
jgi:ABC-2 type transport system ATP-binding protein